MALALATAIVARAEGPSFTINFPAARSATPLDGRVILLLSRDFSREPRAHVEPNEPLASPYLFGLNVDGLAPGREVVLDDAAFGWPAGHLSQVPEGDYFVQAVLNRYEVFRLSDGRVLKLPPDKGEGQQWARKPGNLYSLPQRVHIEHGHATPSAIAARSGDPSDRAQSRHGVRQARPDSKRAAVEVLGPRRVSRRTRTLAVGLRQSSTGSLSAHGVPRPLSG